MSNPVEISTIAVLVSVAGAAGGMWYRIETRLKSSERDLLQKIEKTKSEIDSLRIETMREYASVSHLEKVEARLVTALDRLTEEVSKLRETWADSKSVTRRATRRKTT